jgi:hypothetical protein
MDGDGHELSIGIRRHIQPGHLDKNVRRAFDATYSLDRGANAGASMSDRLSVVVRRADA